MSYSCWRGNGAASKLKPRPRRGVRKRPSWRDRIAPQRLCRTLQRQLCRKWRGRLNNLFTHPPQNVGAPEPPVSARAPKTRKPSPVSRAQNEQTVKLADGRELTFGGLTFGVEHSYANQKTHTNAQAAALLSASEQRDGGMRTGSALRHRRRRWWLGCIAGQRREAFWKRTSFR